MSERDPCPECQGTTVIDLGDGDEDNCGCACHHFQHDGGRAA